MPLYTYMTTYRGAVHIAQVRHSNFKGFATWITDMPVNALPGLSAEHRKNLNPYAGDFIPVPNQDRVWKKTLAVDGSDLTAVVVETKS